MSLPRCFFFSGALFMSAAMVPSIRFLLLVWLGFLTIESLNFSSSAADGKVGCKEMEKLALLKFKQGLNDPGNRLSSWVGEDCCTWRGIRCNNRTGHVVAINLRNRPPDLRSAKNVVLLYEDVSDDDVLLDCTESCLSGEINPSLLQLKHLNHLDLSMNDFVGIEIPKFMGSLQKLRYLNLSRAGFRGRVPDELGNLSSLRYLDLNSQYGLHVDTLHWLSGLSSLQFLGLKTVDLSKVDDWLESINKVSSIQNLQLRSCRLQGIPTSLPHVNFSLLSFLDLSENNLGPAIPVWLFNISSKMIVHMNLRSNYFRDPIPAALGRLCNLKNLDLSSNNFSGDMNKFEESFSGCIRNSLIKLNLAGNKLSGYVPDWLGKFTNLEFLSLAVNSFSGPFPRWLRHFISLVHLSLARNSFSGSIPPWIGELSNLTFLDLSFNSVSGLIPESLGALSSLKELYLHSNRIDGPIPESTGELSELVRLNIANNSMKGVLSEAHFSNLRKLKRLSALSNSLVFNLSSDWVPPFQLEYIIADDCKLGPRFPAWLQTQKNLSVLSMSNASISDVIPHWFWNSSSHIDTVVLSNNQLSSWSSPEILLPNLIHLDLSNNSISGSGSIFRSIGQMMPSLMKLSLSSNHLSGSVPFAICNMSELAHLYLSRNHLSGEIPSCIQALQWLTNLDLGTNNLSGEIPSSMGNLPQLSSLHLNNNKLLGRLPQSLCNCTELVTLDLGGNGFSGNVPAWIGEKLSSLKYLILRSNKFDGVLPSQLSQLEELQVLDLSQNKLSGAIPESFGNFSAMFVTNKKNEKASNEFDNRESIFVSWKGRQFEYSSTVSLVMNIDLSNNDLSGGIPREITRLRGLQSLNLSGNHLTGSIPGRIGEMEMIESLDLSRNQLSGTIPNSLLSLTYINHLNLSYNYLSGRIPLSNQLSTLDDSSIYMGNPYLCGHPLPNKCPGEEKSQNPRLVDDEERSDGETFFIIGTAAGFVVGFWLACGILLLKRSWGIAFYFFFEHVGDRMCGNCKNTSQI